MEQVRGFATVIFACAATVALALPGLPLWAAPQATAGATARSLGTVQAIQGGDITLKTDAGASIHVLLQDSTRMLRIEPGQRSLAGAAPLERQDLQVGDRILVLGKLTDNNALAASTLVAIKRADLAKQQESEELAWEKNGVGGLVKSVDPATKTIALTVRIGGTSKTVTVRTSSSTMFKRYAPGSVRYQDAKPGTFAQIQAGDQLRARGTFSADGSELTAAEVVSGSFRNVAGPVTAVDPAAGEITVMDRLSKQPVVVKFTPNSLLHQLPPRTAQEIAAQLRPRPAAGPPGAHAAAAGSQKPQRFSQLVRSLPEINVGDLRRGDIVMLVATESAPSGPVTAVNLVSGAGPILTAAPSGKQSAAMQSLWAGFSTSAGGGGGEDEQGSSGQGGGGGGSAQGDRSR